MKDIKTIASRLRKAEIEDKARHSIMDTFDLVMVNVELYPEEILEAAQAALGEKVITAYYAEMYRFAIEASTQQTAIKVQQLNGVILTHQKIQNWLKKMGVDDAFDLNNPYVLKIYLKETIKQMENALEVFKIIAKSIGE